MQELNPAANFSLKDLMRPGCLLGLAGLLLLIIAVIRLIWFNSTPVTEELELNNSGNTVKLMVWMVVGVGITIFGALISYIEYKRR